MVVPRRITSCCALQVALKVFSRMVGMHSHRVRSLALLRPSTSNGYRLRPRDMASLCSLAGRQRTGMLRKQKTTARKACVFQATLLHFRRYAGGGLELGERAVWGVAAGNARRSGVCGGAGLLGSEARLPAGFEWPGGVVAGTADLAGATYGCTRAPPL